MEAGLRPDSRLDDTLLLTEPGVFEPECLAAAGGDVYFGHGSGIHRLGGSAPPERLVDLGGEVTALASNGAELVASVVGRGVVRVDRAGAASEISTDVRLQSS